MKMILTRGVPASGKSTFAKSWVEESPETRLRVNRDNLRWMIGVREGVGTQDQENLVTKLAVAQVEVAAENKRDVVIDETNLRAKNVKQWLAVADRLGYEVEFKDFRIDRWEAKERDQRRGLEGGRWVGFDVIDSFFNRFLGKDGALPPIPTLDSAPKQQFKTYQHTVGLPTAIMVDIDGTLAHMTNRGPYDTTKYADDSVDWNIRELVNNEWSNHRVIVMSGRDAAFKAVLMDWLNKHNILFDEIYMRPEGDVQNDAIVKDKLFEQHVAGRYNIAYVLDDRDRVVKMWREKGLTCLQVAYGDF